jgi:hypothetical protein
VTVHLLDLNCLAPSVEFSAISLSARATFPSRLIIKSFRGLDGAVHGQEVSGGCGWLPVFGNFGLALRAWDRSDDLHLHSLGEYLAGRTLEVSVLGVLLRQARRELISGASAIGLPIVTVKDGSPAEHAGLAAFQERPRKRLSVFLAGGGDLIIAVDGSRVRNLPD